MRREKVKRRERTCDLDHGVLTTETKISCDSVVLLPNEL